MLTGGQHVEWTNRGVVTTLWRLRRALGLWIAGTRASSVDGELLWRSSGRAAAMASTPVSRAQAHDHTARLTIHSSQAG